MSGSRQAGKSSLSVTLDVYDNLNVGYYWPSISGEEYTIRYFSGGRARIFEFPGPELGQVLSGRSMQLSPLQFLRFDI